MKKRLLKKITLAFCLLLMCSTVITPFLSCGKKSGKVDIWSTYNTLKVMQNYGEYPHFEAKIDISLAKGETEGAQIVITPKKDVKSYSMEIQELTDGKGNSIKKEQIEVYKLAYIHVTSKTEGNYNEKYPVGDFPDMMLPLDKAIEYKENSIEKGKNQSIVVEVTTTSQTVAGVYTGTFKLNVDGKITDIPVTVEVWDMDISKAYGQTLYNIELYSLKFGELEMSSDIYITYYETMLNEYRLSAYYLPGWEKSPEEMLYYLEKYWDHPYFTAYSIPTFTNYVSQHFNEYVFYDYVETIARACTPEKLYFDKATIYQSMVDEPHTEIARESVRYNIEASLRVRQQVYDDLVSEGWFNQFDSDYQDKFYKSLMDVTDIVTTEYSEKYYPDTKIGYCPSIKYYDNELDRKDYAEHAKKYGTDVWTYHCIQPQYPYPTIHIDDYLIGSRLMSWMQQAYDIVGCLYYSVALYHLTPAGASINPYKDPVRWGELINSYNGDGFIFYPGIYYGYDKPLGSIRGASLRDGQEDYALIGVLDDLYKELCIEYGIDTVNSKSALQSVYNSLFTDVFYTFDDQKLIDARKEVSNIYNIAKNTGFVLSNVATENEYGKTEFYLKDGATVKVNGKEVSGTTSKNGKYYQVLTELTEKQNYQQIEITYNEKVYTLKVYVGEQLFKATDFATSIDSVTLSELATKVATDNGLEVVVKSSGETPTEMRRFKPYFAINSNCFNGGIENVNTIKFNLTNNNSEDVLLYIALGEGKAIGENFYTIKVNKGETVTITINDIQTALTKFSGTPDKLVVYLENAVYDENESGELEWKLLPDRKLTIQDVYYSGV